MIKFECINCAQVISAPDELLGKQMECPTCKVKFWPDKFLPVDAALSLADMQAQKQGYAEWQKIQRHAVLFCNLAKFFIVVGVLAFMAALIGNAPGSTIICASSFGTAFWFYLVGQIIHIRAMLSKK